MRKNRIIGAKYLPTFYGEWQKGVPYLPLTMVTFKGDSYISKKEVPVNIDISNKGYWERTGQYNAQLENYIRQVRRIGKEVEDGRLGENTLYDFNLKISNSLKSLPVNVLMFGAKGDGVKDDTNAINKALNYIKENGGILYFPKTKSSTYLISAPLIVPCKNFTLQFECENVVLKAIKPMESVILDEVGYPYQSYINVNINANKLAKNSIKCDVDYMPYSFFQKCTFNNAIEVNVLIKTYMCIMERVNCNNSNINFYIKPNSGNIMTSLTMISCYSNNSIENGYKITTSCYSTLISCGCDNSPNGIGYNIEGRGISLISCGAEKVAKPIVARSFRGLNINSFYMNGCGNDISPTDYLIEMVTGSNATLSGIYKENMKSYDKVLGLTDNAYGYENINILDDSISKTESKQVKSIYKNGNNAIRFLATKEYVNKTIECDVTELQSKLDELYDDIYGTITFNITNSTNVKEKINIKAKKYGTGKIIMNFNSTELLPLNSIGALDITGIKCDLIVNKGVFNQTQPTNYGEVVRFISCGFVVVNGSTINNASNGKGGSAISSLSGSRIKVVGVSTSGTFESDGRYTKFREDVNSLIIER